MHIPYAIKGVIGEKDQISKVIINDLDGNKNEIRGRLFASILWNQ